MSIEKNITKFYLFRFLGGLELTISIFVLFLLANNLSMTQVMILETIFIAFVLMLEVPSGAFADIFGRKNSLAISMLTASIGFIIFGIGSNFWVFLVAQIFVAFTWAFLSGADSAIVYDTLKEIKKERHYAKIFGKGNSIELVTYAFTSLASGALAMYLGYRPLFFMTSGVFFMGAMIALSFREPPIHKRLSNHYIEHLKEAARFSWNHKIVRNLIIYYGFFAAVGHLTWFVLQPFYGAFPGFIIGLAVFIYFMGAAFGNFSGDYLIRKFSERQLLFGLLLVAAGSYILIFFISKLLALALIALASFTCGARDIFVNKEINFHTDSHHRATVVSVQSMSKSLMYAVIAPLIGLFTDIYSPSAAMLMMGVGLCLFFVVILWLFWRLVDSGSAPSNNSN